MSVSTRELISHVVRRLGIGAHGPLAAELADPQQAIATALDLSTPETEPPHLDPPADAEAARNDHDLDTALGFWLRQMAGGARLIEERLIWFWHDHFPSSLRKVRFPYLMWQQHLTIRRHATRSFADLLHALARDPAMLIFLDGRTNRAGAINENFGREVMELFTIGRGSYSEADVAAAARAFSGWVVYVPGRRDVPADPWTSVFVPFRHDDGQKELLGVRGRLDAAAAVDVLLDHPATAPRIAAKLFTELVGQAPAPEEAVQLGDLFRRDYQVMPLVEAIVAHPAFLSDEAVRSRVRSPLERAIGLVQGLPGHDRSGRALFAGLHHVGYVPFNPPNVAGFPKGARLLGPYHLVHGFDLVAAIDPRRLEPLTPTDLFARLGIFDVAAESVATVGAAVSPAAQVTLAINSPEYLVV